MLKIRDDVDLKELEKFGFKKKKYDNVKHYVLEKENKNQDMVFDTENRQLCFCNWGYDTLYDLIKANLVVKE
jgi:hypothetical protein